ncbi:hypothetical protein J3458_009219 [Metarhizium acridum]|uniref:uncharacterized protein n=2 Tax=Metarhizium acridum TaxID=92637 RepID=UPI001C6B6A9C|nr:hypothetical protein J3458_009219 [Metarhizium acridum]
MESSSRLQDQQDVFLYTGYEVQFEDLMKYRQFGFHPITLGEVLPKSNTCVSHVDKQPTYRIMLKIGHGAFCTAWLARDLVKKRYVAIKVGLGSDTPNPSREAEILSLLCKTEREKYKCQRVIELFDAFVVQGPNGFHQFLVTEVVAPLSDGDNLKQCSLGAIRQVIQGFAYLHEEGVVHGDPHLGNLGIALPQLEQFTEDEITDHYASPECIPVVPCDPTFPLHSLPPYIVESVGMASFLRLHNAFPASSEISIRILDFGRAYMPSKTIPELSGAPPLEIRPPEYMIQDISSGKIGSAWRKEADIWAVGCTLFHIETGGGLIPRWSSLKYCLSWAIQFGGYAPESWPELDNNQTEHPRNSPSPYDRRNVWQKRKKKLNAHTFESGEGLGFLNLVMKMVVTNPDERTPMAVLLTDPFMKAGRPTKEEST